jgi:hypothetical protein
MPKCYTNLNFFCDLAVDDPEYNDTIGMFDYYLPG